MAGTDTLTTEEHLFLQLSFWLIVQKAASPSHIASKKLERKEARRDPNQSQSALRSRSSPDAGDWGRGLNGRCTILVSIVNELFLHGRQLAGPFLLVLDLLGTFVFALSGAAAGVKAKLDLFGLIVLAFATGNAGGITRDLLIGAVPPAALRDWYFLGTCILAALITFWWYPQIDVNRKPVLLFDSVGLALFAVTGTQKALAAGLNPVMAAVMGMLSGVGGGILRDILVNETPTILYADLYAVAALAAGAVVAIGHLLHYPSFASMIAGSAFCCGLRVMAIFYGWHLPIVGRLKTKS